MRGTAARGFSPDFKATTAAQERDEVSDVRYMEVAVRQDVVNSRQGWYTSLVEHIAKLAVPRAIITGAPGIILASSAIDLVPQTVGQLDCIGSVKTIAIVVMPMAALDRDVRRGLAPPSVVGFFPYTSIPILVSPFLDVEIVKLRLLLVPPCARVRHASSRRVRGASVVLLPPLVLNARARAATP
jgi:hypothetical protein